MHCSWDVGTCFPNALLGEMGYLVTHQNCIRKLALITEGGCISGAPPLKKFTNLRELSWKGVLSSDDCAALKAFLDLHHKRLVSLEVDFIDWAEAASRLGLPDDEDENEDDEDDEDGLTPLTDLILPERKSDDKGFLPNLQTFSLSAASFKGSWDRLMDGFNLRSVKELRLLNCKHTAKLLDYMVRTNVSFQATKVELTLHHSEIDGLEWDVTHFLVPFDSLEDLFLMFDADYADRYYAEHILHHRDTLRRLVYHRRRFCLDDKSPYREEYCDSTLEEMEDVVARILHVTKLESAGVCAEPSKLQNSFQSIASTVQSLKLLHLRFTGKAERKPKFFKESENYGDTLFLEGFVEAIRYGKAPPQRSPGPSEAESRIRWQQIQGENWREDEEKEMEAFADWAFGRDGFPCLQVLASGDFSYGNRFADIQTLWCRDTRGSRSNKTWRTVEQSDIAENELIDANMDMMSACPVSPLFYKYGQGFIFPGIS